MMDKVLLLCAYRPALPQGLPGQHDRTVLLGLGDAKYVEKIVIVTGLVYLCEYHLKVVPFSKTITEEIYSIINTNGV